MEVDDESPCIIKLMGKTCDQVTRCLCQHGYVVELKRFNRLAPVDLPRILSLDALPPKKSRNCKNFLSKLNQICYARLPSKKESVCQNSFANMEY